MRAKEFIKENDVEERPKTETVEGEPAGIAYFNAIMEKVNSGEIVPVKFSDIPEDERFDRLFPK
jgi:hypothetical protein